MRLSLLAIIGAFVLFVIAFIAYAIYSKFRNVSGKIEELTVRADGLRILIARTASASEKRRYEKQLEKTENKLKDLSLRTISKEQYSEADKLRLKLKTLRILLIFAVAFALITGVFALNFYREREIAYDDYNTLSNEYHSLNSENLDLRYKSDIADWYDETTRIVVADEGALYKTYHTFDCEKWQDHSIWIYNKEQVVDDSEYTKCPDCN